MEGNTTAQDGVMEAQPVAEHRWLQQLLGNWRYEAAAQAPGKPAEHARGTEFVRKLGELWILCQGDGDMPGGRQAHTLLALGFDTPRGLFVGAWFGSMMTNMWTYEGRLDGNRRVLTLDTEGPSFDDPTKRARYRDIHEIRNPGERILSSQVLSDGTWEEFMCARYTRI